MLGCTALVGLFTAAGVATVAAVMAWRTRQPPKGRTCTEPARRISPGWRNIILATLIGTAATAASVALRVHALTTGPTAELAGQNAFITAQIALTDDPRRRPNGTGRFQLESYVIPATLKILQTSTTRQAVDVPITVFATGPAWRTLLPTQEVEVTGRLAKPTPGTSVAAILLVRQAPRLLTPPSTPHTAAGAIRSGLRSAADVLPPDQRGLLPGLVVGDVSRMDPQVTADFREAGLSHLNAVSGANLAIVAGAALALSRLVGLSLPLRAGFAAVAMLAFTVVARPSPSVLRALLMGLAAAIAMGTGRSKDGVAALSATVLFLMLFVPELARSYGFALSVTATAGILLLAPRWRDELMGKNSAEEDPSPTDAADAPTPGPTAVSAGGGGVPARGASSTLRGRERGPAPAPTPDVMRGRGAVAGLARVPESGEGACVVGSASSGRGSSGAGEAGPASQPDPDASLESGRRRVVRLPRWMAEAVAVPAAAQLAVTPVLVLMAGQLTPVAVVANLLVAPAVAPATLLGFGAALVAPVWLDGARMLVIPAGYAVGWIITVSRWAVTVPFATVPWPAGLAGLGLLLLAVAVAVPVMRRRAWRAVVLTVAGAALVAVLVLRPIAGSWPPKGWVMVMCDVGQGDGLVISAGPGRGVIVDTGPDPVVMDRCLRRLGVSDVPLLVLTHPHADHVDGLPGVLRNRRVGAVVVSPQRTGARSGGRITGMLRQRGIPEWTVPPGIRWRFGPSELTVLAPDPAASELHGQGEGSAINNSSVVIHVQWRSGSMLLGGDLETEAQDELARRLIVRADILKTPHHGSNRQSPEFLASLGARAALISVGAGNDYGHPATSTLGLLRRLGLTIHRTDQSGDLAVVEREGGGLAVVPRGP
ncbi:ComEC/Rec2 family competence protein [Nonomuraea sp. NPDC049504]|uniref:ComEC/Rec2 family competence protein n=1 Tax=Nonomuraea sp. NPDC049504 TaxID=3154729 RepID=UPI00343FB227